MSKFRPGGEEIFLTDRQQLLENREETYKDREDTSISAEEFIRKARVLLLARKGSPLTVEQLATHYGITQRNALRAFETAQIKELQASTIITPEIIETAKDYYQKRKDELWLKFLSSKIGKQPFKTSDAEAVFKVSEDKTYKFLHRMVEAGRIKKEKEVINKGFVNIFTIL